MHEDRLIYDEIGSSIYKRQWTIRLLQLQVWTSFMHEDRLIYDEIGSSIYKRQWTIRLLQLQECLRKSLPVFFYFFLKRLKLKGICKIWYEIMK
jgi:hypothetical protein